MHGALYWFMWFMVFGGFGSFIFLIVETLATTALAQWAFRVGPVTLREAVPSDVESVPLGRSLQTHSAKAKVVGPQQVLFRHKYRVFSISTPFPIKGTITLGGSRGVVGRVPLGSVCFIGFWLFGWSVGAFLLEEPMSARLAFLLLGWLFVALMVGISLPLELRRARRALQEVGQVLGRPAA